MRGGDKSGAIEGLPLQMIVILVVVSVVVSGLFLYWTSSDARHTESNLRAALESLATKVADVADPSYFGPADLTLVLREGAFTKLRSIVLGGVFGSPSPDDFLFRYTLSSGSSGTVTVEHRVWSSGEPANLSPGTYVIHLEPGRNPDPDIGVYVNLTAQR